MVVRSPCIPLINTVPHGGQITVHSTNQHSTTWWSDHRAFHQSKQNHVRVRLSCIYQSIQYHMAVRSLCSTSQHSTTWWSDHQPTPYHMEVRSSCIPPVKTVPHGKFISQHRTTWWSDHQPTSYHMVVRSSANIVPHGGQIISQHRTTWWSDHQPTPYHMVVRSSCIPPVNSITQRSDGN